MKKTSHNNYRYIDIFQVNHQVWSQISNIHPGQLLGRCCKPDKEWGNVSLEFEAFMQEEKANEYCRAQSGLWGVQIPSAACLWLCNRYLDNCWPCQCLGGLSRHLHGMGEFLYQPDWVGPGLACRILAGSCHAAPGTHGCPQGLPQGKVRLFLSELVSFLSNKSNGSSAVWDYLAKQIWFSSLLQYWVPDFSL